MPAPFTIVEFKDKDGDIFPVRVGLERHCYRDSFIAQLAYNQLRRDTDHGKVRPNMPVKVWGMTSH